MPKRKSPFSGKVPMTVGKYPKEEARQRVAEIKAKGGVARMYKHSKGEWWVNKWIKY